MFFPEEVKGVYRHGSSDFTKANTCMLGVQYSTTNDPHCRPEEIP